MSQLTSSEENWGTKMAELEFNNCSLVVDLGNSTVSFGLFHDENLKEVWKIPSQDLVSSSEFKRAIVDSLPFEVGDMRLKNIILSSVVPSKTNEIKDAIKQIFSKEPLMASTEVVSPLVDSASLSSELGIDIYANVVEARFKKPGTPLIVVDYGTAFTVVCVDAKGAIKGVAIGPGIKSSFRGLMASAPVLKEYNISLNIPFSPLGDDTESAINSGIFYGERGRAREIIGQMEKEICAKTHRIATGGHSRLFASFTDVYDEIDENHTLKGLYHLFNF